jgi:4-aminobutyrate aminotransferase-like enzyme
MPIWDVEGRRFIDLQRHRCTNIGHLHQGAAAGKELDAFSHTCLIPPYASRRTGGKPTGLRQTVAEEGDLVTTGAEAVEN